MYTGEGKLIISIIVFYNKRIFVSKRSKVSTLQLNLKVLKENID